MSAIAAQPSTAGRQDLEDLRSAGVSNPFEFTGLSQIAVARVLADWKRDSTADTGALVTRLRQAMRKSQSRARSAVDQATEQAAYSSSVVAWLKPRFPELIDSRGRMHCAASLAVYRLHARYGKGTLTVAEHGPMIRASVEQWMRRWGQDIDGNEVGEPES